MAQLSDDCFVFGGPLLPVDEALAMLADRLSPIEDAESVPLTELDSRILANDLTAPMPLPPFTNSAVDGYALDGAVIPTVDGEAFTVAGRIQAGAAATVSATPREIVRVFTGAPMPAGMDTAFMQEDVRVLDDGRVVLPPGLRRGANVRPTGEDVQAGQVVLRQGHRMRPQDVALAAALGFTHVDVRRRIRVAVSSTGNEIVAPGTPRSTAQLFEFQPLHADFHAEAPRLPGRGSRHPPPTTGTSLLRCWRKPPPTTIWSWRRAAFRRARPISSRRRCESAGTLVFWRLGIKPGRPVAMGVIGGTPFIGLPGNPVASFVTFVHIARPAILALSGTPSQPPVPVPLRAAFSYRKKVGRREYVRAHLRTAEDGVLAAVKFPREGAGLLSSLVETDGLVELGEDVTAVQPGQMVAFLPYSMLL